MPVRQKKRYNFTTPSLPESKIFVDYSAGLNDRDSEFDIGDNELTKADNVRFRAQGGFDKRPGLLKKGNTIGSSTKILGLHSYVNKTNVPQLLAGYGTSIYRYTEANTPITIATSTNAQATGYSKDRKVFLTSSHLDANSNPVLVVLYQSGSGIILEWSDSTGGVAYGTWSNTPITIDTSTQIGFYGVMDSSDNIHIVYMSDANTVKYVKLTYGAGPTWSVGTKTTIKGSGASDQAINPCIYRTAAGVLHVAYRYYNGTNYSVRGIQSNDGGTTWASEVDLSTPSTNARHFATMTNYNDSPIIVYQVGGSSTNLYYRIYSTSWGSQNLITNVASSTDNVFTAVVTGTSLHTTIASTTTDKGIFQTAYGSLEDTNRRKFIVVNDGVNDNDIEYFNIINDTEDANATRVSNDSNNNLYPTGPEYVSSAASFTPVFWTEGTGSPYNIKINSSTNWVDLSASLTSNKRQASAYFPFSGAGGTDQIYVVNGTNTVKKWDGTTLTSATATGYPTPTWIMHFENRLWMGGADSRVYYTDKGADNFTGTFPTGNNIDFPEQIGWGIWYRDNTAFLFGRQNVYVISNFSYTGANVGPEMVRKLPNSFGTLSGDTVKIIGSWVYYQSPDGHVRRTNGQYVELVSDKIRGTVEGLTTSLLTLSSAGTLNDYYHLAVAGNAAGQVDTWLVLNTAQYDRNGGGWSVDTGKTTSCFVTHPDINGVPQLFCGESTVTTGIVYRAEIGNSDNGAAITMDVRTGVKSFGVAAYRDLLKRIITYAEASGVYNLQVGYALFTNLNSFTTYDVSLDPQAGTWGVGVWDPSITWGGNSHIEDIHEVNARGRLFKFQFYQSGADEPVSVLGYSTIYATIRDQL